MNAVKDEDIEFESSSLGIIIYENRYIIDNEFIKYPYKYTYSGTVNCYVYEIIENSQFYRSNYDTFISNFKNLKMMNDKIDYCTYYLSYLEEISLNYK